MRIKFIGTGKAFKNVVGAWQGAAEAGFVPTGLTLTSGTAVPARPNALIPGTWGTIIVHSIPGSLFPASICDHPTVVSAHSI